MNIHIYRILMVTCLVGMLGCEFALFTTDGSPMVWVLGMVTCLGALGWLLLYPDLVALEAKERKVDSAVAEYAHWVHVKSPGSSTSGRAARSSSGSSSTHRMWTSTNDWSNSSDCGSSESSSSGCD